MTEFTVLLVSIGDVAPDLLDYVGVVIQKELEVPVLACEQTFALPDPSRNRGILAPPQWDADSLVRSFWSQLEDNAPNAPVRILLITSADIYTGGANYIFATSYPWGALTSTSRHSISASDALLKHRMAKQCISSLIKSFGIPPSPDRTCVTSYCNGPEEFDAKGNRPLPKVLEQFHSLIEMFNAKWHQHRLKSTQGQ